MSYALHVAYVVGFLGVVIGREGEAKTEIFKNIHMLSVRMYASSASYTSGKPLYQAAKNTGYGMPTQRSLPYGVCRRTCQTMGQCTCK